ncbi:MAG: helix-turn-helix transcriptional regulator, partial [Clostridia bacterium]|nr:helix-turn-helix transcriptional regulator [Clostridia bacterium]
QATPVQAGDLFVINANSLHSVVTDSEARYYCLIVDGNFCRENHIDTDTLMFQNHIRDEDAAAHFVRIAESYAHRHEFYYASIRSAVLALMVHLACKYVDKDATARKRGSGKAVENIKIAMGYIQAHFTAKLTMESVADEVGLSVYHFAREFKKVTGVTFVSYINHLRCESAKKMLQSGKYTVAEACMENGFENLSYFSKTFKKFFGKSPASYLHKA